MNIHRRLARRLIAAAVVLSVVLGGASLFLQFEDVDDDITALAVRESEGFLEHAREVIAVPDRIDQTLLGQHLKEFVRNRPRDGEKAGHFIFAELYDNDHQSIAEAIDPVYKDLETAIDRAKHRFPQHGLWYAKHLIDGQLYVLAMMPLKDASGRSLGFFEGVFHVAPQVLAQIQWQVSRAILLVVAAVVLSSAFIYPIVIALNRGLIRTTEDLLKANLNTLSVLGGAIAKRDSDTHAHNFRVTIYAVRLAESVGLDRETMQGLIKGAFLHDVGKIAIPDAILLKPGRLDDAEMTVMKTHIEHGTEIVARSEWLTDAQDVVAYHHEKVDGSGYGRGLAGEDIPITARIFAIADVFDALTSRRPYKEPLPFARALAILNEGRDRHFDGRLLDHFAVLAPGLYDEFANRGDDHPEKVMGELAAKWFETA